MNQRGRTDVENKTTSKSAATDLPRRGGAVVYRVALWKPDLISHVFAISTPYAPPAKTYFSVEQLVEGPVPQFRYQLNLASGKPEEGVKTKEDFKKLLAFITGGKSPTGEVLFTPEDGIILENLGKVERGPLMSEEVSRLVPRSISISPESYRSRD